MRRKVQFAALAAIACLATTPAHAAMVFSQDFSAGLGANEAVGRQFTVTNGKVGHANGYAVNSYSFYQLALDLTEVTDAVLSLDFTNQSEWRYDGFNLVASTTGVFSPADLVMPTTAGFYTELSGDAKPRLGPLAFSGTGAGPLSFDLSAFSGQVVNLRFQFASDYAAGGKGVQLDNLAVVGTIPSAVPEPATWAMMIAGFGLVGATLRTRRKGAGATVAAASA